MADELSHSHQLTLISIANSAATAPKNIHVIESPARPVLLFLVLSCFKSLIAAFKTKPKIVYGGSALMAPIIWFAARLCGARACLYVHGLDVAYAKPIYRVIWRPFIRRADVVVANSTSTAKIAEAIGVKSSHLRVVHPGVEIPKIDPTARERFREARGLLDSPILLSVGRLSERKGLKEFVQLALPQIVLQQPTAKLLIVGDVPKDSLHAGHQSRAAILAAAKLAGVEANVLFAGTLFGSDLTNAYASADVHVFPVRTLNSDPEGFGMVAVEAAAHGLPTVAFRTGGVVDAVSSDSGTLITPNDYSGMAVAILSTLDMNNLPSQKAIQFARQFEWNKFGENLANALSDEPRQ